MIAAIHQPQYLPWIGYFDKIRRADVFIFLDNVQFKKNEWQNRNRLLTPQGAQWITVPVLHDFGQKINETKINHQVHWKKKHLATFEANYGRAKHYDWVMGKLHPVYESEWSNLAEVNIAAVHILMGLLGIPTKTFVASEYPTSDEKTMRLIDLCKQFHADTYLSGMDGSKYMDVEKFRQNNIAIVTQTYVHPVYPQFRGEFKNQSFVSHLSVFDLLCNCGPQSLEILKGNGE